MEEWPCSSQELIGNLIASMPHMCEAVLAVRGDHTKETFSPIVYDYFSVNVASCVFHIPNHDLFDIWCGTEVT
ncbi:hypothetical protein C0J52_02404 [Blattella germanica]|nr:hypothetical protein C0J52_02404 [Blattella germanica]